MKIGLSVIPHTPHQSFLHTDRIHCRFQIFRVALVVVRRSHSRSCSLEAAASHHLHTSIMVKKKQQFVDRSKSSTYHLLQRSLRDVANDVVEEGATGSNGMVLWPSSENQTETDRAVLAPSSTMSAWRERLLGAGLLEDDPERFLKPISGTGTFLDSSGKVSDARVDPRAYHEEALLEVDRQFDSIPLNADCMDEEIAGALFGDYDEDNFEELNDDFVMDAAKEPEGEAEEAFDFEEHVRKLMEKAKRERSGGEGLSDSHAHGKEDGAFFSGMKPLHEDDEDSWQQEFGAEEETFGVVAALSPEEERALCEKFEQTLAEYDSDDSDEEVAGPRALEGNTQVEAALDEFMTERDDDIFMQGYSNNPNGVRHGGSGFSALMGKRMVHASKLDELNPAEEEPPETLDEILSTAKERLLQPPSRPPAEEIFIDGKSYYSERERNPFDCESILSTYSNLDNNPVTIEARRRKKKKNSPFGASSVQEEEPVQPIRLSNKTGLPLGVFPSREQDDGFDNDTIVSVNRGVARNREETNEEKKARKQAIKQEREMARIQKKATKEVFKEEFQKRAVDVSSDAVAGKTVFRFS
jgi:protein LTV1